MSVLEVVSIKEIMIVVKHLKAAAGQNYIVQNELQKVNLPIRTRVRKKFDKRM